MRPDEFSPRPTAVAGPAFLLSEARGAGLSDYACRSARMHTPTSSVRTLAPFESPIQYASAFALVLPEDVAFSHVMAARLWGLPLPAVLARDKRVHVMRETRFPRIERRDCVAHKGLESRQVTKVHGLRVTSLADTWADIAGAFHRKVTMNDLVMVGDAVVEKLYPTQWIHDDHPHAHPLSEEWWHDPVTRGCQELRAVLQERAGQRGIRLARQALGQVRPRVWSPSESYSRPVIVDGGLPEPDLNRSVYFEDGRGLIGVVDLHWKQEQFQHKVAGEYQGEEKYLKGKGTASRPSDNSRRLLLEDDDWKVIEIFKKDIFTLPGQTSLVSRIGRFLGVA